MTYIFVLIFVCIVGFLWKGKYKDNSYNTPLFADLFAYGSLFVLLAIALFIPFNRVLLQGDFREIEAMRVTLQSSREMSEFERATVTKEIIDMNKKIASWKYYNKLHFQDLWIPDEVDTIRLIK